MYLPSSALLQTIQNKVDSLILTPPIIVFLFLSLCLTPSLLLSPSLSPSIYWYVSLSLSLSLSLCRFQWARVRQMWRWLLSESLLEVGTGFV